MKKIDKESTYNFLRASLILVQSFAVTLIIVFAWLNLRHKIYYFFGLDASGSLATELGSDLVVFMPAMLYGALQAFVINRIMGQNSRIKSAIDTKNARLFLEERDRRTPGIVHVMMFTISFLTIGMASLYQYCSEEVAIFAIGTCTFIASLGFFVAIELDNPFNGVSRIPPSCIPKGWSTMTIEDIVFKKVPNFENGFLSDGGSYCELDQFE
ncbi:MAG TPA: hypothetical protein PK886_00260 [Candidatus Paceibacterota bacterium]|nr:hypothetical protein [Candidatus Paceibacterota bacterium]